MNLQVLRDGIRWLRGKPIPTLLAGFVLALAMSIGTTAFSVINAALLRPAPYSDPDRIVGISNIRAQRGGASGVSPRRFLDFQANARSFEAVAAFRTANQTFVLKGTAEPTLIRGARVSKDFFRLLGSSPMLGRTFESQAEISGDDPTVILSYDLWCRLYSCDRTIIGESVVLDDEPFVVIGVMPKSFKIYGDRPMDLWLPLFRAGQSPTDHGQADLHVLARLKKGVSLEQAQAEAAVLDSQLAKQYPETDRDLSFHLTYWWPSITERARPALVILSGAVALILVIACSSLAFVLLAKAFAREKEVAIRLACGAGTLRLAAAFLIEGLLYGSLAGAVGTLLAFWGSNFILSLVPESIYIPRLNETNIDGHVLAFSLAMSVFTGLIFGLISAFSVTRMKPFAHLGGGAGTVRVGVFKKKARTALVTLQMAVAITLSVATALMLRTFFLTTQVPLGFNSDKLLMTEIPLSPAFMREPSMWRTYYRQVSDTLTSTPGVESVAVVSPVLFGDELFGGMLSSPTSANKAMVWIRYVTSGFARTMSLTVVQGRDFTPSDYSSNLDVAIVNETLARSFWRDETPVGKRISLDSEKIYTIIGMFKDFRDFNRQMPMAPEIYLPFGKDVTPFAAAIVRIKQQEGSLAPAIRDQIRSVDKNQPLPKVRTMSSFISDDLASARFFSIFLGMFGCATLLLALIGIYATLSLSVGQRTREIAIRVALGAERMSVITLLARNLLPIIVIAELLGICGSIVFGRFLSALLFGVTTTDPLTISFVCLIAAATAVAASYIPIRSATAVDPAIVLRGE